MTKPRARPAASRAAPAVTLRMAGGAEPIAIQPQRNFASEAMRWSYIARNRDRWTGGVDPGQGDGGPLATYLRQADLQRIAEARWVEVGIPSFDVENLGWELRVFPWEYALSAATRTWRKGPLTVTRHLQQPGGVAAPVRLDRPATVEAAPGRLSAFYDVHDEGQLMLASLGADPARAARLRDPTRREAQDWFAREQPTLVHLAGVDSHQAVALLRLEEQFPAAERRDGMAMRAVDAAPLDLVDAESLAAIVTAGKRKPDLVLCNFYNSASRIAARAVAHGARFAIGHHSVIEDSLAASFCARLYRELAANGGDLPAAFQVALDALRRQAVSLRGACIVLWSSVSLIGYSVAALRATQPGARRPAGEVAPRERIRVERQPREALNYSLLHNKQSPFRTLQIHRNDVDGPIRDIQLRVELNTGEHAFPFRMTLELGADEDGRNLTHSIVLPLTASLLRTQSERIQSTLSLIVTCEGQIVKEETFRVGLAPVDQWQDGDREEWQWLPSFVLPRDAAVARVIDAAQGVLCALADNPAAGFDGYQSVDPNGVDDAARFGAVDKQVQAIWYALLNTYDLHYINPPPSYGRATQRLRTPSQVTTEGRGTCIELALLLAACLEYVDIYPVVFLLSGHAFVGYWRSEVLHTRFCEMQGLEGVFTSDEAHLDAALGGTGAASSTPGYVLAGRKAYDEVRQRVAQRELVPLEATWLTQRGGFESAVAEGLGNLRRLSEFEAMIDVHLARAMDVTPLPLLGAPG